MRYIAFVAALLAAPHITQAEQDARGAQEKAPSLADIEVETLQNLSTAATSLGYYLGLLAEQNAQNDKDEGRSRAEIQTCLERFIQVNHEPMSLELLAEEEITFSVTNTSELTFLSLDLEAQIWSEDRPAPIMTEIVYEVRSIPGGLLPGETVMAAERVFETPRSRVLASQASGLELRFVLSNALTLDGQSFDNWQQFLLSGDVEPREFECPVPKLSE